MSKILKIDELLHESDVAQIYGVSSDTLRRWRYEGNGPEFVCLSKKKGAIRYRPEAIEDHLQNNTFKSTYEYNDGGLIDV